MGKLGPTQSISKGWVGRLMPAQGRYGDGTEQSSATCVPVGTLVATPNGPVPVEHLKVGDTVWSHGVHGDEMVPGTVTVTDATHLEHVNTILVEGAQAAVTDYHRLLREEVFPTHRTVSWTDAKDIRPGDILIMGGGKRATVQSVSKSSDPVPVTNISVAPHANFILHDGPVLRDSTNPFAPMYAVTPSPGAIY